MYRVVPSKLFIEDAKKALKTDFNFDKLYECVGHIQSDEKLDKKYCDHALYGVFEGFRECFIEPRYKLIYRVFDSRVILFRFADISSKSAT